MEEWVRIQGSKYEVSNYGDVRVRLKSGQTKPHRIQIRESGPRASERQYVTMTINGQLVERYIDDLVVEYFGGR